ncbi:hypothetical protein [Bacillus sp. FJAT-26390]|uniref:hypothetical protein n=1 Tax=Bacillus sp. FJAT-26390 TaxID=1743142 RepID=UPI000807FDD6|nr:hypothetical protein [Bacillus sp. FJAT-26390]OBZ13303.1 hypothetical protein A7975_10620 [Bacillus sp. FJAT-26390]
MENAVKAIVKFNDGVAYVLDNPVEFTYYREGNIIIGLDSTCTFVNCYVYDRPSPGFQAFGGRRFDIKLDNGDVIECHGQWWNGGYSKAAELLGEKLVSVTYKDVDSLKSCYVFNGACAIKSRVEDMNNNYDGVIHGYWEYEAILNGWEKPRR